MVAGIGEEHSAMTPIKVSRERLCSGSIHPFQYGQFVEYLCDLVPAMWAEKLYDGGFEGLRPYRFVYLKETDFKERPWYPSGATNRADYTPDRECPISGAQAQRISVPDGPPCTVGIAQDGIAVQRGVACDLALWLRQSGLAGPVRVQLHREGKPLAACAFAPTGAWEKFQARLYPSETAADATLSIAFRGPGTLWLDNASLMPENSIGGWRRDVVEAVRALKPGIIRFGGSALDDANLGEFEWRDTVGDPDRRRPFTAWGGLQPTGPGLEEIVQFCQAVGAEPLICVRVSHRGPQDAADQVQYFNGAPETPLGAQRARNGHPEPYHVRYWQVGNEREGAGYDATLAECCRAMRAVDPTIRLFSSYPTPGALRSAGALLDYVCPHHYGCDNLPAMEADIAAIRRRMEELIPGRPLKIAVTEWNTTAGDWGPRRAMLWTLANALACARYHNLLHRHGDIVEIANRSNLINSFCSGILQTDNHRLYKTPAYYAQQLYATLAGDCPLRVEAEGAPDISATLAHDGRTVVLFAVNDTLADITRPLDLTAFGAGRGAAEVWTLADREQAGEPDVANSFANPERIVPTQSAWQAASACAEFRFPALSLTVLRRPV
jgi:alpha-N-arabinofuranosidase